MTIIEKIDLTDWKQYSGIEFYQPEKVIKSLKQLYYLTEENENNNTYNIVLFSIGNNHCGTYYPAVKSALPIIIEIAQYGQSEISRNCALEILSDLNYCFSPEIEPYNEFDFQKLEKFVSDSTELFLQQEPIQTESSRNQKLRMELIEYIQDSNK